MTRQELEDRDEFVVIEDESCVRAWKLIVSPLQPRLIKLFVGRTSWHAVINNALHNFHNLVTLFSFAMHDPSFQLTQSQHTVSMSSHLEDCPVRNDTDGRPSLYWPRDLGNFTSPLSTASAA
jgi:hypothetical protein